MAWYRIIDKATQARQHVCCEPDQVDKLYPRTRYFLPRKLEGEPGECDEFVLLEGKMRPSRERRAKLDREAHWSRMSRAEMAEAIIAEVMRRLDEREPEAEPPLTSGNLGDATAPLR